MARTYRKFSVNPHVSGGRPDIVLTPEPIQGMQDLGLEVRSPRLHIGRPVIGSEVSILVPQVHESVAMGAQGAEVQLAARALAGVVQA